METLNSILFLLVAAVLGYFFGFFGFVSVLLIGVVYQSSEQRKKEASKTHELLKKIFDK